MRAGLALLCVVPLLAVPPAAADEPGSDFASLSLWSTGAGQSFQFTADSAVPAEVWVPYAAAEIKLGAGMATSSVAWPGEVGASVGSAAVLLGAPPQAMILNDPFVARARSGTGARDVTNTMLPGSTMEAHAGADDVRAASSTSLVQQAASVAGATTATAQVRLTGPARATGEATSSVRDVTVAGVVHVAAVTSRATGSTDGLHAEATGSTVVSGLTVAGQAVTIDDTGLHVAGVGVPADQALDAVAAVLAQAQVTLALGPPTRHVQAGRVEYATGSLLISTPVGILSLGGAQLRLTATRAPSFLPAPAAAAPLPPPAPQPAVAAPPVTAVPPPSGPAPDAGPLPAVVRSVLAALRPLGITTGYGPAWLPAGLLLALLAGAVLRRVPATVLPAPPPPCPTEDQP
jgi:hypothetical protein